MLYFPPHAQDDTLLAKLPTTWHTLRWYILQNRDNPTRGLRVWPSYVTGGNVWWVNRYRIEEGHIYPAWTGGFQPHATNAGELPLTISTSSNTRFYVVRYTGTVQQYAEWTLDKALTHVIVNYFGVSGSGAIFDVLVDRGEGFGASEGTLNTGAATVSHGQTVFKLAAVAPVGSKVRLLARASGSGLTPDGNTSNGRLCGLMGYNANRVAEPGEAMWMVDPVERVRPASGAEDYVSKITIKDDANPQWTGGGHQGGTNCQQCVSFADQTTLIETQADDNNWVKLNGVATTWEGLRGLSAGELTFQRTSVVVHPDYAAGENTPIADWIERFTISSRGSRVYHKLTPHASQAAGVHSTNAYVLMHSVGEQDAASAWRAPAVCRVGGSYLWPPVEASSTWAAENGPTAARDLVWEVPRCASRPWARLLWSTRAVARVNGLSSGNTRKLYIDCGHDTNRTLHTAESNPVISEGENEFFAAGGLTRAGGASKRVLGFIEI